MAKQLKDNVYIHAMQMKMLNEDLFSVVL